MVKTGQINEPGNAYNNGVDDSISALYYICLMFQAYEKREMIINIHLE